MSGLDWQKMFIGDSSPIFLVEIIVRTIVMYVYSLLAARFIGKRGMGQLTPFEYIFIVTLGSATGDPMFYPDVPLLHGMLVITILVLMERLVSKVTTLSTRIEREIESFPALVIKNGRLHTETLQKEHLTENEIMMALRTHGIVHIGEVRRAYLEPSGELSIIKYSKSPRKKGKNTFPEE